MDGSGNFALKQNQTLTIKKSPFSVPFLHWKSENTDQLWANKLNDQLKWNTKVLLNGQKPLKGKL